MEISYTPSPHTEAAALIRDKPAVVRAVFNEVLPELRGRMFTIAGIESANVMQRVQDSIASIAEGTRWDDAKDGIVDELEPFLGDGSERRAELLLRTHGFQAFQATNWRVAQEDGDTTHLQYLTMEDDRVRDSHAALEGIILPKDDPFWQTHFPPWEWGCRCRTRPMNPDLVDEAKAADNDRAPDDKLVLEGPALTKLREGTIIRNGQTHSVLPPHGEQAFHWHPDDLRLSLSELEKRYDPEVWETFMKFAKDTEIAPGISLSDWLKGRKKRKSKAVAPEPPPPVSTAGFDALTQKLDDAGFKKPMLAIVNKIPDPIAPLLANLKVEKIRGGAFYRRGDFTMRLNGSLKNWSGRPSVLLHEAGHHVHYQSGIITNEHIDSGFVEAMKKDRAAWEKWAMERHPEAGLDFYGPYKYEQVTTDIAKAMDIPEFDSAKDIDGAHRVSRITDTISGLTNGDYGMGHSVSYMRVNGPKEVFAHAFSVLADGDPFFKKMFPNVLEFLAKKLKVTEW